jgi:hypothetical protein
LEKAISVSNFATLGLKSMSQVKLVQNEGSQGFGNDRAPDRSVAIWLDLMRTCDKLLMAGLRQEVGPSGDIAAAYRKWYTNWCQEHDRAVMNMLTRIERAGSPDVDRSNHQGA